MSEAAIKRCLKGILGTNILGVTVRKNGDISRDTLIALLAKDDRVVDSLDAMYKAVVNSCPPNMNIFTADPQLGDVWYVCHNWDKAGANQKGAVTNFFDAMFISSAFKQLTSTGRKTELALRRKFRMGDKTTFTEHKPQHGGESYIGQPTPSDTRDRHETQKTGNVLIVSNLSNEQGKGELQPYVHPDALMDSQSLPIPVSIKDSMTDISSAKPLPQMNKDTKIAPPGVRQDTMQMKNNKTQQSFRDTKGRFLGKRKFTVVSSEDTPHIVNPPAKLSRTDNMVKAANKNYTGHPELKHEISPAAQQQLNVSSYMTSQRGTGMMTSMGGTPSVDPSKIDTGGPTPAAIITLETSQGPAAAAGRGGSQFLKYLFATSVINNDTVNKQASDAIGAAKDKASSWWDKNWPQIDSALRRAGVPPFWSLDLINGNYFEDLYNAVKEVVGSGSEGPALPPKEAVQVKFMELRSRVASDGLDKTRSLIESDGQPLQQKGRKMNLQGIHVVSKGMEVEDAYDEQENWNAYVALGTNNRGTQTYEAHHDYTKDLAAWNARDVMMDIVHRREADAEQNAQHDADVQQQSNRQSLGDKLGVTTGGTSGDVYDSLIETSSLTQGGPGPDDSRISEQDVRAWNRSKNNYWSSRIATQYRDTLILRKQFEAIAASGSRSITADWVTTTWQKILAYSKKIGNSPAAYSGELMLIRQAILTNLRNYIESESKVQAGSREATALAELGESVNYGTNQLAYESALLNTRGVRSQKYTDAAKNLLGAVHTAEIDTNAATIYELGVASEVPLNGHLDYDPQAIIQGVANREDINKDVSEWNAVWGTDPGMSVKITDARDRSGVPIVGATKRDQDTLTPIDSEEQKASKRSRHGTPAITPLVGIPSATGDPGDTDTAMKLLPPITAAPITDPDSKYGPGSGLSSGSSSFASPSVSSGSSISSSSSSSSGPGFPAGVLSAPVTMPSAGVPGSTPNDYIRPFRPGGNSQGIENSEAAEGNQKWYTPTLRLSFTEGDANIVNRVNQSPDVLKINRVGWQSFNNYDWESNEEYDNPLHKLTIIDETRRFYSPLDKDDMIEEQARLAIQESYDGVREVFHLPEGTITDGECLVLDTRGDGNLTTLTADETENVFRDVYMEPWAEIPESSSWKQFTQVEGSQLPDSMLENSSRYASNDAPQLRFQNAFIQSTRN